MTTFESFLGVRKSLGERRWADRLDTEGQRRALAIAQRYDIPEIVARVLASRISRPGEAQAFLNPTMRDLMPDPSTVQDMNVASERLFEAIQKGESIVIFGDYDVDGATASALAHRFFSALGLTVSIYIPDRIFEGYGPNAEALTAIRDGGADLVVAVDCGTASIEPLTAARDLGLDVVVLDHHQPGDVLPPAVAIVNPNRQDDLSDLGHLAAVGVVFLTLVSVNRLIRQSGGEPVATERMLSWLPLVALGTVCDVVPLVGLNRAFVRRGLEEMAARRIAGLRALADSARVSGPPDTYHLGFALGPRINAGGRIGRSDLGARLLSLDDDAEAERLAAELDYLNRERQSMEAAMVEDAIAECEKALGQTRSAPFLLCARNGWHQGVIGVIASRLKDRFGRPAFVVSLDGRGNGTGSARSVPGIDLGALVRSGVAAGVLEKGGGHAMAAGFTVGRDGLSALRVHLEEALHDRFDPTARDALSMDGALTAGGLTAALVEALETAGPYGAGNPDPLFVLPQHRVFGASVVGKGHVRCALVDGAGGRADAIAFRAVDTPLGGALLQANGPLHLAGHLRLNRWRGSARVQFQIRDAAPPNADGAQTATANN